MALIKGTVSRDGVKYKNTNSRIAAVTYEKIVGDKGLDYDGLEC